MSRIGIIGGTGLDDPGIFQEARDLVVTTPYGNPSSPLRSGKLADCDVVLIARHGRRHTIPPSQINSRANIKALADAGCDYIVASAACGSLRAELGRGELVVPDQFIDFTRHRPTTFFDEFEPGAANTGHTPMAEPFNEGLRRNLLDAARGLSLPVHDGGVILTMEGPRFSTRAESNMYRVWGADLVNMTVAPEAILANELGIPYAAVAMVTDYDSWNTAEPPLSFEEIVMVFNENIQNLTGLLLSALPAIAARRIA